MKEVRIEIQTDWIKLDQLLKFAEIVDSGGIAKLLISEGYVKVNNEVCLMRGKKIKDNDIVIVKGMEPNEESVKLLIIKKV